MRILFTIAHYFRAAQGGFYGSINLDPSRRVAAISGVLTGLHQIFGMRQGLLDGTKRRIVTANTGIGHQLDIVVCTSGTDHLLLHITELSSLFHHHSTFAQPMLLGFECHEVLKQRLGKYDYYCYLEDDIQVTDPYFFQKLAWFQQSFGDQAVLQPNRYEVQPGQPLDKLYIDGNLAKPSSGWSIQDMSDKSPLEGEVLGLPIRFQRVNNPHSGCFFLNLKQMEHWAEQSYFLDRDTSFTGPLESAATLGVAKTFKIYKPARENAAFLEVWHSNNRYLGNRIKLDPNDLTRF